MISRLMRTATASEITPGWIESSAPWKRACEVWTVSPHTKKSPKPGHSLWRRGRDSNSGRGRPLDGFQDRCIKPLCHLSIKIHNIEDILKTVIKLRFIDDLRLIAGGSALRQSSLCCDSKTAALNHSATSPQDSFAVNRNLLLKTEPKVKHFLYN